jgi:hypothetical protein
MTKQLEELRSLKDKEIADRDQKLNRLKMQMADALKGNSWYACGEKRAHTQLPHAHMPACLAQNIKYIAGNTFEYCL